MSERTADAEGDALVLEYELDAAPEKVWRAISIPAYRERWLPTEQLADPEPFVTVPGCEARYRMRDHGLPSVESVVTFQLSPGSAGGTRLRIVHRLPAVDAGRPAMAANNNRPRLSRAA